MVYEVWKSKQELQKHLSSVPFKRMLEALEMSTEKPEIRFEESETTPGIEWLERAISA